MQDITKTIDDVLSLIPTEMQFLSLRTRIGNIKSSIQLDPNKMLKPGAAEFSKLVANIPPSPWKQQIDAYLTKVRAGESPDIQPQQVAVPPAPAPLPPPPQPAQAAQPIPVLPQPSVQTKALAYAWMAGKEKLGIVNETGVMIATVDVRPGEDPRTLATATVGVQFDVEFIESPMLHDKFLRIMGYKAPEAQKQNQDAVAMASSPDDKARRYLALRREQYRINREIEGLEAELFGGV